MRLFSRLFRSTGLLALLVFVQSVTLSSAELFPISGKGTIEGVFGDVDFIPSLSAPLDRLSVFIHRSESLKHDPVKQAYTREPVLRIDPDRYLTHVLSTLRKLDSAASFTLLELQLNRKDSMLYRLYKQWAEVPPQLRHDWVRKQVIFLSAIADFLNTAALTPTQLRENVLFLSKFNRTLELSRSHAVPHVDLSNPMKIHSGVFYIPSVLMSGSHRGLLGAWLDLLDNAEIALDENMLPLTTPRWLIRSFENAS